MTLTELFTAFVLLLILLPATRRLAARRGDVAGDPSAAGRVSL